MRKNPVPVRRVRGLTGRATVGYSDLRVQLKRANLKRSPLSRSVDTLMVKATVRIRLKIWFMVRQSAYIKNFRCTHLSLFPNEPVPV